ncbi:MAG: PQQ-binding-like beta-propeller repeat protein, partial [bacterium]|nr:PQQ-binding-like beta-propeller repeat protein [bacterium]
PILIEHGGKKELILWHPAAVSSLDPATGKVYWEQPFRVQLNVSVATPVTDGSRLLVSSEFDGSLMLELDRSRPSATVRWADKSSLNSLITTPVIQGNYIYGISIDGELRCLDADTGKRMWETLAVTGGKAHWAAGFLVKQGDRNLVNNDAGELIIASLSEKGYREIDRTRLIQPTSRSGNRRTAGGVNWSHPAYANRHIVARNDKEILRASLEER